MFDPRLRQTVSAAYGKWHRTNLSIATFCATSALARPDAVANMEFTALAQYVRDPAVAKSFKDMFQEVYNSAMSKCTVVPDQAQTCNIRVFLAAYMCAFFPASMFETMGFLETAVHTAARRMHTHFGHFVEHWMLHRTFDDLPADMCDALVKSAHDYASAFKAWQIPDQAVLATRIRHAIVALLRATGADTLEERRGHVRRFMGKLALLVPPAQRAAFVEELVASGLPSPDSF